MRPLPTRRAEAWRYSDIEAVAAHWPPAPPTHLAVPAGGSMEHVLRVDQGGIHDLHVDLAPGAALALVILVSAPAYARVAVEAHLGQGSSLDLGGVLLGSGDTTVEIVTDICHDAPGAQSRQRLRAVVDDRATASYLGRIAVARDAQQTDAAQSARALVLKRTAAANLKPELEIFADDVKCAHGCTVGELDRAALFYLQSRGLPPAEAQSLLTRAFVADAFSGLAPSDLRDALEAEARAWLEARA